MNKLLYSCLLFLCPLCLFAQPAVEYNKLIKEAEAHYNARQYKESVESYQAAFHSGYKMLLLTDVYNAAVSMTQAGTPDSAFKYLNLIAGANFVEYDYLLKDAALASLHADARWEPLCKKVKENKDKKDKEEANYNKPVVAILDTVYNDDQLPRKQQEDAANKYGRDSKEYLELKKTTRAKDSINVLKVTKILDQYGWMGTDLVGWQGNRTLFLVIQHADQKTQEKYLPMLRQAVKDKKAAASNLALLEDRLALKQGKKQIYGSQVAMPKDGQNYVEPLEDPDNVDKRRASVGLPPLAEYLKHFNLTWDPETYKKQLPEIEKKEKESAGK